jgi:tetratricopeptide (TPR) repeat protein
MSKFWIIGFVFLAGTSYAAAQTDAPASPPAAQQDTTANVHPWTKAEAVLAATATDVKRSGIRAVESHAPDLEQALVDGKQAFQPPPPGEGPRYVLTDGSAETLMALLTAAADQQSAKTNRNTIAVKNPYPMISMYLGSYYNEVGKNDDAVRVLNEGIALRSEPDSMGETLPFLLGERGAALAALRKWEDSLTSYDKALMVENIPDQHHARLFRGRGYALTELNRLDDAEEAYKNSLRFDPNNALALHELQYIASIKAGGLKSSPGSLKPLDPPKPH